jgi:hypothetical protein
MAATQPICDLLEYPNLDIIYKFYYSNLTSAPRSNGKGNTSRPRLARYALQNIQKHNLTDNNAILRPHPQAELLVTIPSPLIGEIPTFNSAYATKPNRYIGAITEISSNQFQLYPACSICVQRGPA